MGPRQGVAGWRRRVGSRAEAFERDLLELRWEVKKLKLELALRRFQQKYSLDQPRVPAGNPAGGQWTNENESTRDAPVVLAQAGFGTLVAEIPVPGGRRCVYNFGVISVAVPGAVNFRCYPRIHWSGAAHGTLLNDN